MRRAASPLASTRLRSAAPLALALVAACVDRPARFADRDAVEVVDDERPIPMPAPSTTPAVVRLAQVFAEHVVVGALDPQRTPPARDVNALDEVPKSSWFTGSLAETPSSYEVDGPPRPPFSAPKPGARARLAIVDARGLPFELVRDDPDPAGPRASTGAVASRLVHRLGYHVAESYAVTLPDGGRALAIRWPASRTRRSEIARDLGPTAQLGTRFDDANDGVEHQERRSLRALGVVSAWLGLDELRPSTLRDQYVGAPGRGFVEHELVGFEDALGSGLYARAREKTDPERPSENGWLALVSLGFAPKERPDPARTLAPGLGIYFAEIDPESAALAVPFPAAEDALPTDRYWIAKRLARVGDDDIARAVAAADLSEASSRAARDVLVSRRDVLVRHAFAEVTPLEIRSTSTDDAGCVVTLDDLAVARKIASPRSTRYEVDVVDDADRPLVFRRELAAEGSKLRVSWPCALHDRDGIAIVRVRVSRSGVPAPRPVELHFRMAGEAPVLRGVVH